MHPTILTRLEDSPNNEETVLWRAQSNGLARSCNVWLSEFRRLIGIISVVGRMVPPFDPSERYFFGLVEAGLT